MRKNSLRRSTINPLTQKINSPQHLLRFKNEEDGLDNEWYSRFRLPSLPQQKSWKDGDNDVSYNGNSAATSVSWSQEVEDTVTQKLEEQWATIERTFYEEDDQLFQESILNECIQWRTQILYLRIVGKVPTCTGDSTWNNILSSNDRKTKKLDNSQNDEVFLEHNLLLKGGEDSIQYKLNRAKFEEVLDTLMEYVILELFLNEKNIDTDSLRDDLNDTLRIFPIPGNRNSSRNLKTNWTEEAISPNYIENKSLSIRNRLLDIESSLQIMKNDIDHQGVQKRLKDSISANRLRDFVNPGDDNALKERLCTPHIGRNKLGTIFNERIVVSPVPFTVSTRESFSTLKTVPIKFINENFQISSCQGSARNISGFRKSARKSSALKNSNIYSTWQAPVCPTVWPKNIRLAPIDTSRFPSSKTRSLAPSPAVLHCSRKPLSPISHSTVPKSAHTIRDHNEFLTIQGKHIVPAQSKISLLSAGWNCPRVIKEKKKKTRTNERF
ncbi:hypothetical protein P5V15_010314 [Pogonomyrmex californicus]